MDELKDGILLRSNAEAFALGGTFTFKPDFLAPARHMIAPEVAWLQIRIRGDLTAGAGGSALGRDAAKLVTRFKFLDKQEVINASGAVLRVNQHIEMGANGPPDPADIAALGVSNGYLAKIHIPLHLPKAHRPRDTRIPLEHFLEGGQLEIVTPAALPTNWSTFLNGRIQIFALVVDGRTRELKSRLTIRELSMTRQEDNYDVYGSLRSLVGTSSLTTSGYSSWAAFTVFNSQTLRYPASLESDQLVDRYRNQFPFALNAADEITLATPGAVPFVTPDRDQKIGAMIDAKTVHIDLLAAPPANPRLLVTAIKDRDPLLAALVAGYANVSDYQAALATQGRVVTQGSGSKDATGYLAQLVRRMPVRLGGGIVE